MRWLPATWLVAQLLLAATARARPAVLGPRGGRRNDDLAAVVTALRGGANGMVAPAASAGRTRSPADGAAAADGAAGGGGAARKPRLDHTLMVEEPGSDLDNGVAAVHPDKADELGVMSADIVRLRGKRSRETLCTLEVDEKVPIGSVWLSRTTRDIVRTPAGQSLKVYHCDKVKPGLRVQLSPVKDADGGLSIEEILEQVVKPHYVDAEAGGAGRPIHVGDIIRLRHGASMVECHVDETEPRRRCLVTEETELEMSDEEYDPAEDDDEVEFGYEDIGGVGKQLTKIRELVELPMRHPQVFTTVGVRPPRGVLIHGPPGCGKTMIAKAVAAETGAYLFLINGPEVMSKMAGESEKNLRAAFENAEENAPSIIFIDEIDAIAPRRDKAQGEVEKRIVSQLLTLLDGLKPKSQVVVMAATNRPNAIEPALRRFGRFDLEINIPVPDEPGRLEILQIKTKDMRLSEDVDLTALAHDTQGYCGADLAQAVFESAMQCVREKMGGVNLEADTLPSDLLDQLRVEPEHVQAALSLTNPSTLRESAIEVPNVTWEDIGGLEDVKRELKETVQYPVQYADKFEFFGMSPSKGAPRSRSDRAEIALR